MGYEGLILDREAGIATLTLNRPEQLNAITRPMAESLGEVLNEIEKDDSLKVLIITGAGRAFCAGLDVNTFKEVSEMAYKELGDFMRLQTLPFYNLSKPTIAAINGVAVGAGLSLALLCDIRIASDKARFSFAQVKRGLIPDIGTTYALPRLVGMAKAMELVLTGDTLDATEALQIGIINRVVPEADLIKAAREFAEMIVKGPSIAIGLAKQAIQRGIHNSLEEQITLEALAQYICLRTEDHKEGVRSFFEKRPPQFKGR